MQILFGPSHDARHVEPDTPNGYEWWYFDAISDDGHYALVVIFFLGTPMSPYYKAVVDGKNPLPQDWCGVFVSLHEREGRGWSATPWRERAYAYNLYRGGEFATDTPVAKIGGSQMRSEVVDGQWRWHLTLDEPGLWRGRTQAELTFTLLGKPLTLPPVAESDAATVSDHHWACVAPRCRVEGTVTPADGKAVTFGGTGYHDHNFGMLPWRDAIFWFWARLYFKKDSPIQTAVFYRTTHIIENQAAQSIVLFFDEQGTLVAGPNGNITPMLRTYGLRWVIETLLKRKPATSKTPLTLRNAYGLRHESGWEWEASNGLKGTVGLLENNGLFSEGPFYRRLPTALLRDPFGDSFGPKLRLIGAGIGEVFQPSRLCGPIASRAMWTRMRRRS